MLFFSNIKMKFFSLTVFFLFVSFSLIAEESVDIKKKPIAPQSVKTAENDTVEYPLEVKDDKGTKITIMRKPNRIISCTLMTDEILLSMISPGRIKAVSSFAGNEKLSNVAKNAKQIDEHIALNVEKIISLDPDIVFTASWSSAAKIGQLRDAGIPVYQIQSPVTITEIKKAIKKVGKITDAKAEADYLVSWMDKKLESIHTKVNTVSDSNRKKVLDYNSFGTASGAGSSWNTILQHANIINPATEYETDQYGSVPMSKELLVTINPDILVLPGWLYGDKSADAFRKEILKDPALQAMRAVQNNKVIQLPEKYKTSTSHYLIYAVEEIAEYAYSQLFNTKQ